MTLTRKRPVVLAALLVLALASVAPTEANVSLRNGNFFIGYTDVLYPGGFEPKVERVYNSKSPYSDGMFGWGWGTEYEAYLRISADGSVVVHEYGGGAENRFVPKDFKKAELDKAVNQIAEAARALGVVGTAQQLKEYKGKLASDSVFRNQQWERFVSQKKLSPRQLSVGMQLISNRFSYQFITKTKAGYQRNFDNGRIELFDNSGKLAEITDKNGNFIKIAYSVDGKVKSITDNFNRKMFFKFNNLGLVEKIEGEGGKSSTYKYNDKRELVSSKDMDGNVYEYRYSDDNRHNMVQIRYSDKTTMDIAYYGRDKQENVKSIKDRDGSVTEYSYVESPSDKNRYSVSLAVKGKDGRQISSSKYDYQYKVKASGETWTYRMDTVIDGERTETVYNECCGLPVKIKKGGEVTEFKYDSKGHVTEKKTPTEITKLAYHPKFGKVTRVENVSRVGKKKEWSSFEYDAKGNLVFAKNSSKKGVKLVYDQFGRIRSMIDQSKRVISFKYNENSKPVEITDPKLGTITVQYTNSGEIKRVDSTAGRRIALQVTSSFQNLLDIIRPAGVSLSF